MIIDDLGVGRRHYVRYNGRGPWYILYGFVLKCDRRFWAWDWYNGRPYLSNLAHSEVFVSKESARAWAEKHQLPATPVINVEGMVKNLCT